MKQPRSPYIMRVGIDARAYGWTGIGRYARNLLKHLARQASNAGRAKIEYVVFVPPRYARDVSALPGMRAVPVLESYYSLYEQTGFLAQLLSTKTDLVHFLSFNAPVYYRRPFIVTIHDLTRFKFPGAKHHDRFHEWAHGKVFRSAVERSRRIITVSAFTKSELLRAFPAAAGKTAVVYEGVEEQFFSAGSRRGADGPSGLRPSAATDPDLDVLTLRGITKPYLLYVGLWLTHKNLPGLLKTFRLLQETGYQGLLVVTGAGRPWDENVPALAEREGIAPAVRFPGRVPDRVLAALYRQADVFLFPSLSEGFGLPPLEAMASGTPVVAARAGSLPEILGDAALFAEPKDPAHMADVVRTIHADEVLRQRLTESGRQRARQFSWTQCARATLTEYERAVEHSATLTAQGDAKTEHTRPGRGEEVERSESPTYF